MVYDNEAFGEIEIIPSPMGTYYGNLIKDSWTMESREDDNFVFGEDLFFSDSKTTFLEWQFEDVDDSNYNPSNETNASLRIYISRANHRDVEGIVHTIGDDYVNEDSDDNWSQHTITYNNQPKIKEYTRFTIPSNFTGWLDIDVGNLIRSKEKENNTFTQSLAITTEGRESRTYSRRSGLSYLSPQLNYSYYIFPPNLVTSRITATYTHKVESKDFFEAEFFVDSNYKTDSFKSNYKVKQEEETQRFEGLYTLYAEVRESIAANYEVPSWKSKDKFPAKIDVTAQGRDSFSGNITIKEYEDEARFPGVFSVEREEYDKAGINYKVPRFKGKDNFDALFSVELEEYDKAEINYKVPEFTNKNKVKINYSVRIDDKDNTPINYSVPKFRNENKFKGSISVIAIKDVAIPSRIKVPKFKGENKFAANLSVVGELNNSFKSMISIKEYEGIDSFSGSLEVSIPYTTRFKANITISPAESKNAYTFIM